MGGKNAVADTDTPLEYVARGHGIEQRTRQRRAGLDHAGMEFNNGNQVARANRHRDCASGRGDRVGCGMAERWLFELTKVGDKRELDASSPA